MGEKKSMADDSTPEWLAGLGSETLEQLLWFRNWLRGDERWNLDDKHKEIIERGWMPIIRGEYKKYH